MRHVSIALAAGLTIAFAAPLAGQTAQQAPAYPQTSPAQPTGAMPGTDVNATSKVQSNASEAAAQGNDRKSNSAGSKPKICEVTVIRAGPNQGQMINKCHR